MWMLSLTYLLHILGDGVVGEKLLALLAIERLSGSQQRRLKARGIHGRAGLCKVGESSCIGTTVRNNESEE